MRSEGYSTWFVIRKPIATFSLRRQRTSGRQRASHFHGLVNGDVYGSRILITTPTSLSHVRDTACALDIRTACSIIVNHFFNVSLGNL